MACWCSLTTAAPWSALAGARRSTIAKTDIRGRDGRLLEVVPAWTAEAERWDGDLAFASASGMTADEAWAHLRDDVEAGRTLITTRLRLLTR